MAVSITAALAFTAAYSLNVSADTVGRLLSGVFAGGDIARGADTKIPNFGSANMRSGQAALDPIPSTTPPDEEEEEEVAEKVEPGARRRSEDVYGPFDYDIFIEREKNGEFPPQDGPLPSSTPFDSLGNNNSGLTATSQFTQSETDLLAFGNTVVIGFNDSGSNAGGTNKFTGFARSTDGGATFVDGGTLPTNPGGDAGDPVLARNDTTGRIYFATLGFSVPTIQVFRSDDNGATWMPPVNGTPGGASEDKQWMAVDNFVGPGNGNVYLMSRNFGAGNGIFMYRSTDNGATFGPTGGVNIVAGNQGAYVTVGPDHAVYAFWFNGTTLRMRKSTDQALTFGPPITVATGLVGGTNGDHGLTGRRQGTTTFSGFRSSGFPHVAVNPVSGHLYVTYATDAPGADKADVFLVQSTDGGATWGPSVRVNDDATTTDQWQPTIAVSTDGSRLGVFYYSRQEDTADNNLFKYYGRIGAIAGPVVSFTPSFAISDVASLPEFGRDSLINSVYMGDYNHAVATPGFFHVVWSDNRDDLPGGAPRKDPNIYYDKIPLGLAVTSTDPLVGSVVTSPPTSFTVNVTEPVDASTLEASDFVVNGSPADSVTYTPGNTSIGFAFNTSPVTVQGLQTMSVAAGAFTRDPDGSPVVAFTGTFRYDTLQLQVVSTSPPFPNGVFTLPGPFAYDVTFNEPIDPASVQTGDLTLSGIPGSSVTGATVLAGNMTVRFTLDVPVEGTLTASISAGAITDAFGNIGSAFSAPYGVDIGTVPYPVPLVGKNPFGSMIYDPSASGVVSFAGDVDGFTLNVDPGQTITLLVGPTVAGLQPSVTLLDPSNTVIGSATAGAAGQNALLQTAAAVSAGTYTIQVSGAGGTVGGFQLQVLLNSALEVEGTLASTSNNTIGTAQNIDASFITLQTALATAHRGAATGTSDSANYMASAVPFSFTDISGTGTIVAGLTNQDDTSISVPIGFNFPFYGSSNTAVFVSSNGLLTFGTSNTGFTNADLTTTPTQAAIAPFWDDQHTNGGAGAASNVFTQILGSAPNRVFVIQWNQVRFFSGGTTGDTLTYQALLGEDGSIRFNYQDLTSGTAGGNNGGSATVGVKAAGTQGPDRLLLAFNSGPNAFVGTGLSTLLSPPNPAPDFYAFTANAGDILTLGSKSLATGTVLIDLLDGGGTTLASGAGGPTNLDEAISNFAVPAAGTYYARVTSGASQPYNLVVTRNAAFDTEANDTFATAQSLGGTRSALGAINRAGSYSGTAGPATFEDISGTGTVIAGLTNQDDASVSIPIGFNFPFYGAGNSSVFVSSNGLLTFGTSNTTFTNADLTTTPAQAGIAVFWDDQHTGGGQPGSNVYSQVSGSGSTLHLTIQWNQVRFFSGGTAGDTITYQAQLYADGRIQLNYLDLTSGTAAGNNGASATVGVKADGTQGPNRLLLAFNNGPNAFVGTGKSTSVSQPAGDDWYSVTIGGSQTGIRVETSTPADGPGEFVNVLDPKIELYSPANVLIASGSPLGDGRNESLAAGGLAPGTYRIRVASDGSTSGEYFMSALPYVPPTISKSFGAASIQYSDTTTMSFTINNSNAGPVTGVAFTDNLPAGLAVAASPMASSNCGGTFTANAGASSVGLSGGSIAAGGSCTISVKVVATTIGVKNNTTTAVSSNESGAGAASNTASITVTREDANVALVAGYPFSEQVNSPGGTAGPITRCVDITEVADGSPGNISNAVPVTFTVTPVAAGPSPTQSAVTITGGGVGGTLRACVTFSNVAVNVYDVHVQIGGNFYQGATDFVLVVFDPSLGFVTGGGTFTNPNTGYPVNFGMNGKYLKNGQSKGSLLVIEHRPTGDVILKSNAIQSLSIVGSTAILIGKATLNGSGGYSFRATVTDNGEPGFSDQFGLQVTTPNTPALTFAPVTMTGGNIQVPQ